MCKFTISIFQFMQNFRADLIDSTKKTLAEQYLIQFSKKSGAFYGPASPYRPTATSRLSYFTHFSFFCHCSYTIPIFSTIKKRLTYLAKIRPSLNENGLAALLKASGFAVFFHRFRR